MKELSIIIPAFNEEKSILDVLFSLKHEIEATNWNWEVVVVDDGSSDKTANIVLTMAKNYPNVRLLKHETNLGYGATLKTGIKNTEREYIMIIDADGSYPVDETHRLLAEAEEYEMVIGARTGKNVNIPLLRRPAKFVLSKLANYLSETKIPDVNSGMRVFRKDIVEKYMHILPNGFSFTTTLTLACIQDNQSIKYVPISYHKRKGKSSIHPIKDFMNFIILIVRTTTYFNPLKVFLPTGVLFLLLGLIKLAVFDLALNLIRGREMNVAELSILFLLAGAEVCFFGLLADLIVKKIDKGGK